MGLEFERVGLSQALWLAGTQLQARTTFTRGPSIARIHNYNLSYTAAYFSLNPMFFVFFVLAFVVVHRHFDLKSKTASINP